MRAAIREGAIAVVGIGCRYPGGVNSLAAMWRLVDEGVDAIRPMPPGRFDTQRFVDPQPRTPGKIVTAEGGFLDEIDLFDADFFGISPREAAKIDPQHRFLLELSWEAFEDAAIVPSSLAGSRTGVYMGLWSGEYESVMSRRIEDIDLYATTGGGRYAAAGRVAFALDLRGPSMTVDTACSSSLVALHLGCQALRTGEADLVLAGAANLILQPYVSIGYSRSGMLSPGGRCRFGAPSPDGYVRSEGAAVVLLKPLAAALRDANPVHAVILGSSVNSDGGGSGRLVAPSEDAQASMLRVAYDNAGVSPERVAYVEAHGTGTAAGDRVELQALSDVLGRRVGPPLPVGSIKTLIGHTEAASGLAGVIKAIAILEHRRVPGDRTVLERNPEIPWPELGLEVVSDPVALDAGSDSLVVGVNSFGVTGTNAHVVLAEAPESVARASNAPQLPRLITIAARTPGALRDAARELRGVADGLVAQADSPEGGLRDLSYTTTCCREHHPHRLALVVDAVDEVTSGLDEYLSGEVGTLVIEGEGSPGDQRLGFVFSGQGSQWVGMGRELMERAPEFSAVINECEQALGGHVDWSLRGVLAGQVGLDRVEVIQPTLSAVQIALAKQLMAWGVHPAAVVGHSMGEVAAAHLAGALSLPEAMLVISLRSKLLSEIAGQGAMALVDMEEAELQSRLPSADCGVSIAAINGPRSTVVSGDPTAIDALLERLEREDVFCRRVKVDVASHSTQTDPLLPRLLDGLSALTPATASVPFYSTVRTESHAPQLLDPAYWVENLRRPVRLAAAVQRMVEDGIDLFVEIAPHPILLSSLADIAAAAGRRVRTVAGPRRDEPEYRRLLETAARLHVAGVSLDWSALAEPGARPLQLPHYPWQRERHWIEDWEDWSENGPRLGMRTPRPEEIDTVLYRVDWQRLSEPGDGAAGMFGGSWLVVGGGGIARGLAARIRARGGDPILVPAHADWSVVLERVVDLGGIVDLRPLATVVDGGQGAVETALECACAGPLALVRALVARGVQPRMGLWWVTQGAQGTGTRSPEIAAVPQAALWGFARTLWQEHPELESHLVDLAPDTAEEDAAEQLAVAASTYADEPQLSYSEGVAHASRLVRAKAATQGAATWRSDASYLITGGLGDLGLLVAEEMVRGGATRLVLSGRTGLPPRERWSDSGLDPRTAGRIEAVLRLEGLGASVHVLQVDVGDELALKAVLDRFRAERWPELRGVVHCAGQLRNQLVRELSWDGFMEVMAGKAVGAWNLHRLLPHVDQFALFSSVVPILPQSGQSNYAAANAFLDALARARSASGAPAVSLAWGVWEGTGLARDTRVARYVEVMKENGLRTFAPDVGQALFRWTAGSEQPHLMIASVDWPRAAARLERRPGASFYAEVLKGTEPIDVAGEFAAEFRALPEADRRSALVERLRLLASHVLGVAPDALPINQPLGRRGLDSLMAMEFRNRVELQLDLRVQASAIWNYPTIERLADFLLERLDVDPVTTSNDAQVEARGTDGDIAALVAHVENASEEEVLRMLRESR